MEPRYPSATVEQVGRDGNTFSILGRVVQALSEEEALALTRSGGGATGGVAAWLIGSLGYLAWLQGYAPHARSLARESLTIAAKAGATFFTAAGIMALGDLAIVEGALDRGTRLIGAFETLSPKTLGALDPDERAMRERCLTTARAALGDAAFARARAEAQAMTLEQAVAYALGEDGN